MAVPAVTTSLVRSSVGGVAERGGELLVVGADHSVRNLSGASAELARAVLAFLAIPHSRPEITAQLERLSGKALEHPQVVTDLLKLLLSAGLLRDTATPAREGSLARPAAAGARVVLGLTGAIGTAHAPALVGLLLERGYQVEIAATRTALRMVSRLALEAITHRPVHAALSSRDPAVPVPHLYLAEWAEAVLVSPATATTIARIAHGDCSDVVAATVIATRAPILIVPSMNPAMLEAPAVQRNLELLRGDGLWLVDPTPGHEVARAPSDRASVWGAAPSPLAVLSILEGVLALKPEQPASG